MSAYVSTVRRPPRTLVDDERDRLLKITGEHRAGFRDHMIFSVALGTGLREHEICALNVGDIMHADERIKRRFPLRVFKRSNRDAADQQCVVPDTLAYKLTKYIAWKRAQGERLDLEAPLFVSRLGKRIATRTVRLLSKTWQERAGFDRHHSFHALRHTALTGIYRRKRDVRYVQSIARHRSVASSMIYIAPGDQEVEDAMRDQVC
jgi:site-specific recombinase XerC